MVSDEAEAALEAVAAKYGMTLSRGNGRFSPDRLTVKFDFCMATGTGAPSDFAQKAKMVGLPEDCFGKTFISGSTRYTVTEINLRRRKYPVSGTGPKGGRYKFTADTVKRGLVRAA
jgi:hypothetical protein|tara:strand:+ start:917 stop:1264 length:348 start_codon:yes stop_codon:yes gene_type:complete